MTTITKALIIDERWISLILAGRKTWEMRSKGTSHRGWFGLIRKGTGAVWGVARMVDSLAALSPDQIVKNYDKHLIPEAMIRSGKAAKWKTPWVLTDVKPFKFPIHYTQKKGPVTWVNLDAEATAAISRQFAAPRAAPEPIPNALKPSPPTVMPAVAKPKPTPAPSGTGVLIGQVLLTEGSIRHRYIRFGSFIHKFPPDAVGGSNKDYRAKRNITVDWGAANPVETDIDGQKAMFRSRSLLKLFLQETGAEAGDVVLVEELAPYRYTIRLRKQNAG